MRGQGVTTLYIAESPLCVRCGCLKTRSSAREGDVGIWCMRMCGVWAFLVLRRWESGAGFCGKVGGDEISRFNGRAVCLGMGFKG